jgi:hypothetical protein
MAAIITFCTCQWNEWTNIKMKQFEVYK